VIVGFLEQFVLAADRGTAERVHTACCATHARLDKACRAKRHRKPGAADELIEELNVNNGSAGLVVFGNHPELIADSALDHLAQPRTCFRNRHDSIKRDLYHLAPHLASL
jgi:hypothetical protein